MSMQRDVMGQNRKTVPKPATRRKEGTITSVQQQQAWYKERPAFPSTTNIDDDYQCQRCAGKTVHQVLWCQAMETLFRWWRLTRSRFAQVTLTSARHTEARDMTVTPMTINQFGSSIHYRLQPGMLVGWYSGESGITVIQPRQNQWDRQRLKDRIRHRLGLTQRSRKKLPLH